MNLFFVRQKAIHRSFHDKKTDRVTAVTFFCFKPAYFINVGICQNQKNSLRFRSDCVYCDLDIEANKEEPGTLRYWKN